ncbi:MAG TPA: hypothetical protein VFI54_01955 [Solirubrobacteraceae bacterium]|nr:hypothetical protein [Solirubrobacteraceae bacterium]
MTVGARVIFAIWAAFLALAATVEWALFTRHTPNYYLLVILPAVAIGGALATALLASPRRDATAPARPRIIADLSMPSALVGIAVGAMLWGAFIGEWLLLIGAGLFMLGLGGVIHELVETRRLADATTQLEPEQSENG